nr:unnamed protein product [Callosobruchus analis]
MRRLQRQSKECLKEGVIEALKDIINFIVYVANYLLCKRYLAHIFGQLHEDSVCRLFSLDVPFQYCPSLIRNRQFPLKKGYVEIDCKNWQHLLLSLYHSYLRTFLREMEFRQISSTITDDIRIHDLINSYYYSTSLDNKPNSRFNFSQIHSESKYFPLCMLNLYKILERTNRLAHNESLCVIYSETVDYQCLHICSLTLGPSENGGCPFKHFSDTNLKKALNAILPNQDEYFEVIIRERHKDPSAACRMFYKVSCNVFNNVGVVKPDFSSPVEYYLTFKAGMDKLGNSISEDLTL